MRIVFYTNCKFTKIIATIIIRERRIVSCAKVWQKLIFGKMMVEIQKNARLKRHEIQLFLLNLQSCVTFL